MEPVELFARGRTPLTERLMQINYQGACVIAAHQHCGGAGAGKAMSIAKDMPIVQKESRMGETW